MHSINTRRNTWDPYYQKSHQDCSYSPPLPRVVCTSRLWANRFSAAAVVISTRRLPLRRCSGRALSAVERVEARTEKSPQDGNAPFICGQRSLRSGPPGGRSPVEMTKPGVIRRNQPTKMKCTREHAATSHTLPHRRPEQIEHPSQPTMHEPRQRAFAFRWAL